MDKTTLADPEQPTFLLPSKRILLLNHMDAWAMSFGIATLGLVIHQALSFKTLILLAGITLGYWLAFALNDYYDAPFDAHDPEKARRNYFTQITHPRRAVRQMFALSGSILWLIFAQFGLWGIAILALCILVMWAYSAPPIRLKSRPGLDLLAHALFVETFPYLITLILIEATWTRLDYVLLSLAFIASLTAQLEQQLRDYALDAQTDRNFTTTVGPETTRRLLRLATLTGVFIFTLNLFNGVIPPLIAAAFLSVLPLMIYRFLQNRSAPRPAILIRLCTWLGLLYAGGLLVYFLLK